MQEHPLAEVQLHGGHPGVAREQRLGDVRSAPDEGQRADEELVERHRPHLGARDHALQHRVRHVRAQPPLVALHEVNEVGGGLERVQRRRDVPPEVRQALVTGLQHGVLDVGVVARLQVVDGRLPDPRRLLTAARPEELLPLIGLVHGLDPDRLEHLTRGQVARGHLGDAVVVVVDPVEVHVVGELRRDGHRLLGPLPLAALEVGELEPPALLQERLHQEDHPPLHELVGLPHAAEDRAAASCEAALHPVGLEAAVEVGQLHAREREATDRRHELGEGREGAVGPGPVIVEEGLDLVRSRGHLEEAALRPPRGRRRRADRQEGPCAVAQERAEVLLGDGGLAGRSTHGRPEG